MLKKDRPLSTFVHPNHGPVTWRKPIRGKSYPSVGAKQRAKGEMK